MNSDDGSIFPRGLRMVRNYGWRAFVRRSSIYFQERFLGQVRMHFFKARFIKIVRGRTSLEEVTDLLYDFRFLGLTMKPLQERREILGFMKFVENLRPGYVLEIGTGFGGTLLLFTRAAAQDALIMGLDLPPMTLGIGCPKWREPLLEEAAGDRQTVSIVRGNSHDHSTYSEVSQHLGGRGLDVLFIDGDHSYEGVKEDFEMYSKLVRKGGVVAFHDIVPNRENPDIGVPRLWSELKPHHRYEEFSLETDRNGIGLLYMD